MNSPHRPKLAAMLVLGVALLAGARGASVAEISRLVGDGHWREARQQIAQKLAEPNLDFATRQALLFQTDRMARIRLDFEKTRAQVFAEARTNVPTITEEQFAYWEKAGAVESMEIDGERWYFNHAAANLFRINPQAKALKMKLHPDSVPPLYHIQDVRSVIASYDKTAQHLNSPKTWRITYELKVKPGQVPPGETIRAWLPFPRSDNRQSEARMVSANPPHYILSTPDETISSVYMEQPAAKGKQTRFRIVLEYTCHAEYQPIDPNRVQPASANDPALASFMGESPPEIVFSPEIEKLAREIVGTESNPYLKARRIFQWVYEHVPWTSAREYSTIECLPLYALGCRHGDCGIKTMTFMTLCRFSGIPARWESGWVPGPEKDMHDWCEIYLAPYGWMPADVTYGLVDSVDEREKWYYLGGIDASRLVVNTDYSQPLYPAKTFFRSEIVDFQRGEVEWRGGNLYFNQWNWDFQVEEVPSAKKE